VGDWGVGCERGVVCFLYPCGEEDNCHADYSAENAPGGNANCDANCQSLRGHVHVWRKFESLLYIKQRPYN
jgi:hypothetical protein